MQVPRQPQPSETSHLTGSTLLLEEIAVDAFGHSSFGAVVLTLFQGLFTAPSWQTLYRFGLWLGLKPPPMVEAFFTTDLSLSPEAILAEYRARWAVEIAIRDASAFAGLVLAAAHTLWFIDRVEHGTQTPRCRYRP